MHRTIGTLALTLAVALMVAGCGEKPPASRAGKPEKVVAVGSQWYGHLPVWAGIERGIFHHDGFEVEWRFIPSSRDRVTAVSSGQAQFASLGEIAMLRAMAEGERGFYWVGSQDVAPGFEGLVARPGIGSIADLRGRTIGLPLGSSAELTARQMLTEHGLDADRDVRLVDLGADEIPGAFRAGRLDAAVIWEPELSRLSELEGARVLARDSDTQLREQFGTVTAPDVLILEKAWVDEDPARARRFMAAYFRALTWVKDNTEAAAELVQGLYIQQDADLIRSNLDKLVWHDAADQRRVMSDRGIFAQAEQASAILHDRMGAIARKPAFREWVNLEALPGGG